MSESRTFHVPECNLDGLKAAIEKLNHKAAKLSTDPITLQVLGHEDREGEFGPERTYEIAIAGPEPILNGWQLIAKLEPGEAGNVIKRILRGSEIEIPELYWTAPIWCDHCQTNRIRKSSYLVRNVETGEYKQVGTSCLADFTGHGDPERIAAQAEWLSLAWEQAEEASEFDPDRDSRGPPRYYTATYLSWVVATIKRFGWLSRSKAEYHAHSTASIALRVWTTPRQYLDKDEIFTPTEADETEANAALAWARTDLATRADLSEYERNLVIACAETSIPYSWTGLVASLIPVYSREIEKQIRLKTEGRSEWQGEVKKRQVWGPLTVLAVIALESEYGYGYGPSVYYIYKFQDPAGNIFIWKSSCEYDWSQGDRVKGKATVKEHGEYKGVKQTVLTRCAFETLPDLEAAA